MDFKDQVVRLSDNIKKQKDKIATEEATKNAFIMPMIAALGYDVFNPFEVVHEMDCDLIKKKGEKSKQEYRQTNIRVVNGFRLTTWMIYSNMQTDLKKHLKWQ